MRFLCELSPRTTKYELNCPAISLLGGELALPTSGWPASAALIGNSDTTAKSSGWQVHFRSPGNDIPSSHSRAEARHFAPDVQKAAPNGAAFNSALATGLPSHRPAVVRRTFRRFSGRLTLFRVRSWRLLLPEPAVLGVPFTAAGTSLAPYHRAIDGPFWSSINFSNLRQRPTAAFLDSGIQKGRIILKIITPELTAGTEGKNASHGRPGRSGESAFCTGDKALPFANKRNAPVGRTRAFPRHPRSRKPMIRPD